MIGPPLTFTAAGETPCIPQIDRQTDRPRAPHKKTKHTRKKHAKHIPPKKLKKFARPNSPGLIAYRRVHGHSRGETDDLILHFALGENRAAYSVSRLVLVVSLGVWRVMRQHGVGVRWRAADGDGVRARRKQGTDQRPG